MLLTEHDSAEEIRPDQGEEKRRRRRRKRKTSLPPQSGRGGAAQVGDPNTEPSETPVNDGQECMSKNKKRKLKKKRHKEKLRSMGLIPQAAALEFTYKKDVEEEEDDERRATEVSDFLRTTMKLYASDCKYPTRHLCPPVYCNTRRKQSCFISLKPPTHFDEGRKTQLNPDKRVKLLFDSSREFICTSALCFDTVAKSN